MAQQYSNWIKKPFLYQVLLSNHRLSKNNLLCRPLFSPSSFWIENSFLEFKKAVFVFSVFRRREERVIETAEQRFAALQRFAIDRLIMSHSIGPKRFIKYFSLSFSLLIAGTQKYHRIIELRKVNTSGIRRCLNQSLWNTRVLATFFHSQIKNTKYILPVH